MGLFGKKETKQPAKNAAAKASATSASGLGRDISSVLKKPRITEKAVLALDKNVYTFEVHKDATKYDVRDAVKELYKVTPVKVRMVTKSPRQYMSRMRGRKTLENGLKKAYVYLKEGDRIDLA